MICQMRGDNRSEKSHPALEHGAAPFSRRPDVAGDHLLGFFGTDRLFQSSNRAKMVSVPGLPSFDPR